MQILLIFYRMRVMAKSNKNVNPQSERRRRILFNHMHWITHRLCISDKVRQTIKNVDHLHVIHLTQIFV